MVDPEGQANNRLSRDRHLFKRGSSLRGESERVPWLRGERLPRLSRRTYEKVQVSPASTGADLIRRDGDARPSSS